MVQEGKVVASAWLDRKVVMVMSTNTQPSSTSTVLRRQQDGTRKSIPCPQAIIGYNQHMGRVDRGDQGGIISAELKAGNSTSTFSTSYLTQQ